MPFQRRRHLQDVGDLGADQALVHQAEGLIVQVAVQVPLLREVGDDVVPAPGWPVVRGERDVGVRAEQLDGFGEVAGPDPGVADLRAAQRQ